MIQKIKRYILVTLTGLTMLAPGLVPAVAFAASTTPITDGICQGSSVGTSSSCDTSTSITLTGVAAKIINVFSVLVGVVAVIMVIFGGFKYITSGGDSNSVSGAKNTLIYAIVGLIVVALAQFIVHFVLNTAKSTGAVG